MFLSEPFSVENRGLDLFAVFCLFILLGAYGLDLPEAFLSGPCSELITITLVLPGAYVVFGLDLSSLKLRAETLSCGPYAWTFAMMKPCM